MGMQVFEYGVEVAGISKRFHDARKFAKRNKRRIYLERVPDNKRESNAIRVIGKSRGWLFERKKCIGYVPADIARKLVLNEMEDKVTTRLQLVSINDKKSIEIRFDILGSKDYYEKYCT
jgi:HIRAN domain